MQIISYVIEGERQILLEEYIAQNAKDFSTNKNKIKAVIGLVNSFLKLFKVNLKIQKTNTKQRTSAQNRAYWLWISQIIEVLEENGIYATNAIGGKAEWTKELLHHTVTHDIIFKEYGKSSTAALNSNEIEFVIDRYTEMFGSIGVELPEFPNIEAMLFEKNYGDRK